MIPFPLRRRARRAGFSARPAARTGAATAGAAAPAEVLEDRALLSNISVNLGTASAGGNDTYTVADGVQCVRFFGGVQADVTDFTIDASNVTNELELVWAASRTDSEGNVINGFFAPRGGDGVDGEEITLTVEGNEEGGGLTFEAQSDIVVNGFEFTGTNADDEIIGNISADRLVRNDDGTEIDSEGGDIDVEFLAGNDSTLLADLSTAAESDAEGGFTLTIDAGEGDDTLGAIVTQGNVVIDLGTGANTTRIISTRGFGVTDDGTFGRTITVTTAEEGSNDVGDLNARGGITYNGGAADDTIGNIESGVFGFSDGVVVNLGEGTNVTGDISSDDGFVMVNGGSGSDTIGDVDVDGEFSFLVIGSAEARVNLGDGDNATGTLTSRRGTVRYTGGSGNDFLEGVITTSSGVAPDGFVPDEPGERQRPDFGDAVVELGGGDNTLAFATANFGDVSVTAGDGNDTLGEIRGGAALTERTFRGTFLFGSGQIAKPNVNITERELGDVFLSLGNGDNTTGDVLAGEATFFYSGGSGADVIGNVTSTADFDVDRSNSLPDGLNEVFFDLGAGDDEIGDIRSEGGDILVMGGGGTETVGDVFGAGAQQNTGVARFDTIVLDYGSGGSSTGFVQASRGSITIRGGEGDDFLVGAETTDASDQIVPGSSDLARLTIDFGRGDNAVLNTLDGSDAVTYTGGRDIDSLGDVISEQGEAFLQLGADDDEVGDVTAQTIFVDLGQGDDEAGDFDARIAFADIVRGFDTLFLQAGEGDDVFGDLVSALNVVLEAQGGRDVVTFVDAGLNANLDLGDGNDAIGGRVNARFDVNVQMGDGDDRVSGRITAGDSAFVNLGEDDDSFTGFISAGTIAAGGSILLDGDDGDDNLNGTLDATGAVEVDAGRGNDFLGGTITAIDDVEIDLDRGNDVVNLRTLESTTGGLTLDAGDGRDRVTLRNTALADGEDIELGEGVNFLNLGEGVIDGRSRVHADGSLTVGELDDPDFSGRTYLGNRRIRAEGNLQVLTEKAEMEGNYTLVGRSDTNFRVDAIISGDVIVLGSGTAAIDFSGSEIGGDTSVRTSSSNDDIDFFGSELAGDLKIVTIAGTDEVNVRGTTIGGDLIINLGVSDDRLVIADATVAGTTAVNLDRGSDYLAVVRSTLSGDTSFLLGDGNDTLSMAGADFGGGLIVNAGAGRDGVRLRDYSVADDLFITMGGGNDFLNVDRLDAGGDVTANGGGGRDRLDARDIDGRVRSFERRG